jgi:hypothetical protein
MMVTTPSTTSQAWQTQKNRESGIKSVSDLLHTASTRAPSMPLDELIFSTIPASYASSLHTTFAYVYRIIVNEKRNNVCFVLH